MYFSPKTLEHFGKICIIIILCLIIIILLSCLKTQIMLTKSRNNPVLDLGRESTRAHTPPGVLSEWCKITKL